MPMCPSPPAPCTTAVVPGCSNGTAFRTAWYAVRPASASAATSAGSMKGSSFTQARADVRMYSAMPPSWPERPGKKASAQCMSSPARQAGHSPQLGCGCRITVSPTATLVTPSPTEWIQPAFSCPST